MAKHTHGLKVRGWKKILYANENSRKSGVAILLSDKIDFKTKSIKKDKEGHYIMIKESLYYKKRILHVINNIYTANIHSTRQNGSLRRYYKIAEKRETKGKGEKERYTHLNAEFLRIARRDKKVFLSEQCKEIEENNRMGMTRDLFQKIRDTKGTHHAKMGRVKDRSSMDLTETEDTKKRWQEYMKELYKKGLNEPDNHHGMFTHLESDILECEVKWALRIITMNEATTGGPEHCRGGQNPLAAKGQ